MGKCEQCGSSYVSEESHSCPQRKEKHSREFSRNNDFQHCNGTASAEAGFSDLDDGINGLSLNSRDPEHTRRAVTANSQKVKVLQDAFRLLVENQESSASKSKERDKVMKDLSKLYESQEKSIISLQNLVSRLNVEISQLTIRLDEFERTSYEGVLYWKITDYKRKKFEASTTGPTSFYSESFFTSKFGYKMCGRVYLNGDGVGKGTHLSMFFAIKKGDNDAFLKWPFQQRVTFRLVNQAGKPNVEDAFRPDPSGSSFSMPQRDMNIASGCPMFVSQEVVENPQKGFLRNDTILLQIKVDL